MCNCSGETSNKQEESWCTFIFLVIGVVIVFLLSWWIIKCHYVGEKDFYTARGTFGDQFGAVNALFSALAFAGMIYAIVLQMRELRYQRDELVDNRKEMTRQTSEFKLQNSALKRQSFENTFFNMMMLQQQIVSDLKFSDSYKEWLKEDSVNGMLSHEEIISTEYVGRDVFKYLYTHEDIDSNGKILYHGLAHKLNEDGLKGYESSYYRTYLDHYFRHFYTILRYINESDDIQEENKYRYATILRATLSRFELVLLYYNGISSLGNKHLKPLLEKYCMLNNLNVELLTLCKDTVISLKYLSSKEASDSLKKIGFSGTDFEFFITDENNKINKYNITAFSHNQQEIAMNKDILNRMRETFGDY